MKSLLDLKYSKTKEGLEEVVRACELCAGAHQATISLARDGVNGEESREMLDLASKDWDSSDIEFYMLCLAIWAMENEDEEVKKTFGNGLDMLLEPHTHHDKPAQAVIEHSRKRGKEGPGGDIYEAKQRVCAW